MQRAPQKVMEQVICYSSFTHSTNEVVRRCDSAKVNLPSSAAESTIRAVTHCWPFFLHKLQGHLEIFTEIHNYKTRNAQNIHPPLNRILITQSSIFLYHGSILWNNLQTLIKSSKTVKQFKRLYKHFFFMLCTIQLDVWNILNFSSYLFFFYPSSFCV